MTTLGFEQIKRYLNEFIGDPGAQFETNYKFMVSTEKEKCRNLLIYIDKLFDLTIKKNGDEVNYQHIHIAGFDARFKTTILEFITIKFFNIGLEQDRSGFVANEIMKIENECASPKVYTYESGDPETNINSILRDSHRKKEIDKERQIFKKRLEVYKGINYKKNKKIEPFWPTTLINLLKNSMLEFKELPLILPIAVQFEEFKFSVKARRSKVSFNILNYDHSIQELAQKEINDESEPVLKHIENVILFDCCNRARFNGFAWTELNQIKSNELTSFKNLIVLSTDDSIFKLGKTYALLSKISSSYYRNIKDQHYDGYLILPEETKHLTNQDERVSDKKIEFIDTAEPETWNDFKQLVYEFGDLDELIQSKIVSIYALCINEKFKNYIIEDIFGEEVKTPKLISQTTKERLSELNDASIEKLRALLTYILELIINTGLKGYISKKMLSADTIFILPYPLLRDDNTELLNYFRETVQVSTNNCQTWKRIKTDEEKGVLILDYKDCGRIEYPIYPNIMETEFPNSCRVIGVFQSMFYKNYYQSRLKNYYYILFKKITSNPIRSKYFEWQSITAPILDMLKNGSVEDLDQLNEHTIYEDEENERENITFIYDDHTKRSHVPSQIFLIKKNGSDQYFTTTAEKMLEEVADIEKIDGVEIQPIEGIYQDFNVYEKMSNEKDQLEMNQLREYFKIEENVLIDKLWKILLRRKCETNGLKIVYDELDARLLMIKSSMVRISYFQKQWVNVDSDTFIPRETKTFRIVCEYLELPALYVKMMIRQRANDRWSSRENKFKMNKLIMHLISDGCFNNMREVKDLVRYEKEHDLETIGLTIQELPTLVELLHPNIKLRRLREIKRNEK